ncbi:flagellar biosynthetic protein FliO [Bacillus sp. 31A1R]|uniref:Flagellar biosynthetic protein FliO n=1 Tax=Robertmurraya mangrovi TaxID=3098077 RepID=A0ABU5J288_9BACI|nr:flagellar biosynthetic protein FliO [Bacillus sp. 31A1R]MDZ5473470.1 flagellar biosynthetic protein FliO [Bacillus sp. 31A1R]
MQRLQLMIKVLLLATIALIGSISGASAEQLNSVKDCYEQPEKCGDTKLSPQTDEKQVKSETSNSVGLNAWDFFKMIFATFFVIALLYFILKFINKKSRSFKSSQLVENLGGTTLGANRSVQIVKVGKRVLVLGVGENIQLLKEIDDEEETSQIISDYNSKIEQLVQPSDIVTKVIQRTKNMNLEKKQTENNSFTSMLKGQLEEISKGRKKLFDEMEKKGSDER